MQLLSLWVCVFLSALLAAATAIAQPYPSKPRTGPEPRWSA
jgi:hypothetical protein